MALNMQGYWQKKRIFLGFISSLVILGDMKWGIAQSTASIADDGIQAQRLHQPPYDLLGRKIALGQVEIGRPGKFGLDKAATWQPKLGLFHVFHIDKAATPDLEVDNHAAMVAGVMISQDKRQLGVAPAARLYSSAVGSSDSSAQPEECLATQHIAQQNGGDVRAINFSFGESLDRDPRSRPQLDGNALLTQCLDWSAQKYNVLNVVAGNQGQGGIPIPTDHYNGISTAYTTRFQGHQFNKIDFANLSDLPMGIGRRLIRQEINLGSRRAISLSAPGQKLNLIGLNNKLEEASGTSFAAPHITASVALLQEYGDRQIKHNKPQWNLDARRHEVMKAVLLNSADKLGDQGDGKLLGMTRTILTKNNKNWLSSDAYLMDHIPLDIEMGTGQLNTLRAYQQFAAGQWQPQGNIPGIGWNYDTITAKNHQDYLIQPSLQADSYVSITLTWDRLVQLRDFNRNDQYDIGENFQDRGLNDLNVYLLPAQADRVSQAVCRSVSSVDSVEHIFCPVSQTGHYKIRVVYQHQVNQPTQNYAIAWWTVGE